MEKARAVAAVNWSELIQGEYREIPGLHLTAAEAQRFWQLDEATAEAVLAALVRAGFLRKTRTGSYVRADAM